MTKDNGKEIKLDAEWIKLIIEAKNLGISKEEILSFFKEKKEEKLVY